MQRALTERTEATQHRPEREALLVAGRYGDAEAVRVLALRGVEEEDGMPGERLGFLRPSVPGGNPERRRGAEHEGRPRQS